MTTDYKKEVTIIIVTYKSTHIVSEALKNIVGLGYRIIIVDNGSGDNLEEFLKSKYSNSGIELILLENNCGFGKANNLALEMVKTKYAFLLNPDAIIKSESIDNLIKESKKDKKVALVGAVDVKNKNPSKNEIAKSIEDYKRAFKISKEEKNYVECGFLCGGYLLMNMAIFRKIGFFDENMFLYGEDDELSARSIESGYKNILVKSACVFHSDHNSTKTNTAAEKYSLLYKRYWYMGWSKAYLKRKKKNILRIWLKIIHQFLSSFIYIIAFDKKRFVIRFARSCGGFANLLGIDCFCKKAKNAVIINHIKV